MGTLRFSLTAGKQTQSRSPQVPALIAWLPPASQLVSGNFRSLGRYYCFRRHYCCCFFLPRSCLRSDQPFSRFGWSPPPPFERRSGPRSGQRCGKSRDIGLSVVILSGGFQRKGRSGRPNGIVIGGNSLVMDLSVVGPMFPVRRAVFRERIFVVTESARAHGRRIVEADDG